MADRGRIGGPGFALLVGAAAMFVAIAAWWIGMERDASGRDRRTGARSIEEVARAEDVVADLSGASRAEDRVASLVPAAKPSRSVAHAVGGIELPLAEGKPVVVLRGATAERVPFASVSFGKNPGRNSREGFLARDAPTTKRVGALRRFRADADGELFVPLPDGFSTVFAEDGDEWGWDTFSSTDTSAPIELRIYPDTDVLVRVVDVDSGRPVPGIDVQLIYEVDPEDSYPVDTATTDAEGLAVLPHLRQHTEYFWAHTERLLVGLVGPLPDAPLVPLDPKDVPKLIELKTEPFSAVDVTVVDGNGAPITEPLWVTLEVKETANGDARLTTSTLTQDGLAAFEQVRPGLPVYATCHSRLGAFAEPVHFVTDATPGARVAVTLTLGDRPPGLVGRLVDEAGAPLAERDFTARLGPSGSRRRYTYREKTDATGAFRVQPSRNAVRDPQIEVTFTVTDEPPIKAQLQLQGRLGQDAALGDVRLAAVPVIASGRVTDEAGAPVHGASVHVSTVKARASGGHAFSSFTRVRTDAAGEFTAYGRSTTELIGLSVYHDLHLPLHKLPGTSERLVVAAGRRDLHLSLPKAGRITGNILLDEEWLCDFALVSARRGDAKDWEKQDWLDRPGAFELNSLEPGMWTLLAHLETEKRGVLIEDIEVLPGETAQDPRLTNIDLRGKARVVTVRVVDEDGQPLAEGQITHRSPGSATWEEGVHFEDGVGHLYTSLDPVDVFVTADDRRGQLASDFVDGQTVTLGRGIPVKLRWEGPPLSVVGGNRVTYAIVGAEPSRPPLRVSAYASGNQDKTFPFPFAGAYEVIWSARYHEAGRGKMKELARSSLRVFDRSDPQEVMISAPGQVLNQIETWRALAGE